MILGGIIKLFTKHKVESNYTQSLSWREEEKSYVHEKAPDRSHSPTLINPHLFPVFGDRGCARGLLAIGPIGHPVPENKFKA